MVNGPNCEFGTRLSNLHVFWFEEDLMLYLLFSAILWSKYVG